MPRRNPGRSTTPLNTRVRQPRTASAVAMRRFAGIVLGVIWAWACRGNADFSDAMPAPVTLSAEEYGPEITEIDRLIFAEGPFDETRRESLAGKLEGLARRMKT